MKRFKNNTATLGELITAAHASVVMFIFIFLVPYILVRSTRVQFPICWATGLGCEGKWAKNLAVSR